MNSTFNWDTKIALFVVCYTAEEVGKEGTFHSDTVFSCNTVSSLQKCAIPPIMCFDHIEDTNASQTDQKYGYAIECVFAACCEVSRWRAGGGARRQEATFQSVCSAISTPTPPLIIHKYKIQNSKIQKYKNSKTQKYATLANTQIQCKYVIRHIHIHSKSNAEI